MRVAITSSGSVRLAPGQSEVSLRRLEHAGYLWAQAGKQAEGQKGGRAQAAAMM